MNTQPFRKNLLVFFVAPAIAACDAATPSAASHSAAPAAPTDSPDVAPTKLPANFTSYATQSIGPNVLCHVGAVTGDDGMNQKPVAYARNIKNQQILWMAKLDVPVNTFQSRATHCTSVGDSAFVLLQSDTQPEQTLSQTLLRVVKLNMKTGAVTLQKNLDVPKAYSAWVDEGADHFQWQAGALVVSGTYRTSSDNDSQAAFTLHLNSDLKP